MVIFNSYVKLPEGKQTGIVETLRSFKPPLKKCVNSLETLGELLPWSIRSQEMGKVGFLTIQAGSGVHSPGSLVQGAKMVKILYNYDDLW